MQTFQPVILMLILSGCAAEPVSETVALDRLGPHIEALALAFACGGVAEQRAAARDVIATYDAAVSQDGRC